MTSRTEYPRPQLVREAWRNLNGQWEFQIDDEFKGEKEQYYSKSHLTDTINVPFCPESKLSGIHRKDFMKCVWYKKSISISKEELQKDIILHFGAVDFLTTLYINGNKVGNHKGGYVSFSFNITDYVKEGENDITLCVYDDTKSSNQPSGKQSHEYDSFLAYYTRTTGIWQTVWMEYVDKTYIKSLNYISDVANSQVIISAETSNASIGKALKATVKWQDKVVGSSKVKIDQNTCNMCVSLSETHIWDIGQGNLYDVEYELYDENEIFDKVTSYFGLRTVAIDNKAFYLNGRKVFGRWVLDQGFYPDGLYTAPTDEDLKKDIEYGISFGFNGARLHEKIFEERYLYWADKLGYLVWGEYPNWGIDVCNTTYIDNMVSEWMDEIKRDRAHPSIIGWCPFNETWDIDGKQQDDNFLKIVYNITKSIDNTRPVIDTSGNFHVVTDIYDVHDYEQNEKLIKEYYKDTSKGIIIDQTQRDDKMKGRQTYNGGPIFISEYGGIKYDYKDDSNKSSNSFGYGDEAKSVEELVDRFEKLTDVFMENPDIMGVCYTQLYDIEQEMNGFMTYERKYKLNPELIKKILDKKAAIEE